MRIFSYWAEKNFRLACPHFFGLVSFPGPHAVHFMRNFCEQFQTCRMLTFALFSSHLRTAPRSHGRDGSLLNWNTSSFEVISSKNVNTDGPHASHFGFNDGVNQKAIQCAVSLREHTAQVLQAASASAPPPTDFFCFVTHVCFFFELLFSPHAFGGDGYSCR